MTRALQQAWARTVRRYGDERAVVHAGDGTSVTFGELEARAMAWLAQQGNVDLRGRAVVFARANSVAWWEIFLGLVRAGAVPVPLDAGEPLEAQRAIATELRAGFWWDGAGLVALPRAKRWATAVGLIKLTSGSTGRPKALPFSDAQLLADGRQVMRTMGITRRDVNYALIPLGHSYGIGNLVVPLLAAGVPMVIGSAALPPAIAEDFMRWQPTVFPSVPMVWRALASSTVTLASLRLAISAGAPLAPEVAREFAARYGRKLHNFYGSSETGGIAFDRTGAATLAGGVGTAMRGVTLDVRPGQRLVVSSAAVITHGNRRRASPPARGAWVMPDRACVDGRGQVTLLGRRGRTVKIAGRRVNLDEVAARLKRVAGVRETWIAANDDGVLCAALAADANVSAATVRAALHADTAAWKIPRRVAVFAEFPRTARGKVDTAALRARVFG